MATSAAVFTTNAFAAAPVVVNRTECDLDHLVGGGHEQRQRQCLHRRSRAGGGPGDADSLRRGPGRAEPLQVAVGSTGIIGVQLDAGFMAAGVKKAAAAI